MSVAEHTYSTVSRRVGELSQFIQDGLRAEIEFLEARTFLMAWSYFTTDSNSIAIDEGDVEEWVYRKLEEILSEDLINYINLERVAQDPTFFRRIMWGRDIMYVPVMSDEGLVLVQWFKDVVRG